MGKKYHEIFSVKWVVWKIWDIFFKLLLSFKSIVNFHTVILDKTKILHGEVVYKIRNKKTQFISRAGTNDVVEISLVLSNYEYNLKLIQLSSNPVIVDLGAHIGSFSLFLDSVLRGNCRIYAVEPDKGNFSLLTRNIELNNVHSIISKNYAISDYTGKGFLKKNNLDTDTYYLDKVENQVTNCKVMTFSRTMRECKISKIDLLKIDIEGGEYKIFLHKPSYQFIAKNVHYIFMEYHNLNSQFNYLFLKKTFERDFRNINKKNSVLTLENLNWK